MGKRLIPKTHCIKVVMWRNPDVDLNWWDDPESGMSSMETGAGSLKSAMKIVGDGLKQGYTNFVLSYPVSMTGPTYGVPYSVVQS